MTDIGESGQDLVARVGSAIALLVSILSLLISWLRFTRDRSRVRIRQLSFLLSSGVGACNAFRLLNEGRRTTRIHRVYALLKGDIRYEIDGDSFALGEKEYRSYALPLGHIQEKIMHPRDVLAFVAEEGTGKTYMVRTRKIARAIRRVWTPENDWLTHPQ